MKLRRAFIASCCAALLPLLSGCRSGGIPLLNFIPLAKPVGMLLVTDTPLESADALIRHEPFRKAFSTELKREVHLELALPLLLEPQLGVGWQQFALVSPAQYAALSKPADFSVVAIAGESADAASRTAKIVVRADSELQSISQLRDKVVAFGPAEDSRTFFAAMVLLESEGVSRNQLKRQIIPVPGSLLHLGKPEEIARSVASGSAAAGVLDDSYWRRLPERGVGDELARASFRVIGETMALPDRVVLGSPKVDAETVQKTKDFLFAAGKKHGSALAEIRLGGYAPATDADVENMRRLASVQGLFPSKPKPASEE